MAAARKQLEVLNQELSALTAAERHPLEPVIQKLTSDRWDARHICRLCEIPTCAGYRAILSRCQLPLMITAWAAGLLDRRSGELSASRAHARRTRSLSATAAQTARTVAQDGIACLPTVMRAELDILRVDPNACRANPEPH